MTTPAYAIVGRIRKAHGVRGELVVEAITDEPDAIFAPGRRVFAGTADGQLARAPDDAPDGASAGHALRVRRASAFKGGLIVSLESIDDRNEAERWRDRYLLVPVEDLTPPGADEVFTHDLYGMQVRRADSTPVGEIVELYELPQGLMLEIKTPTGNVLVPYRREMVARVDVEERVVYLDPPEGLLE